MYGLLFYFYFMITSFHFVVRIPVYQLFVVLALTLTVGEPNVEEKTRKVKHVHGGSLYQNLEKT